MLFDNATAIDRDNLTIREGLTDQTERCCIELRLGIGGTKHCTVVTNYDRDLFIGKDIDENKIVIDRILNINKIKTDELQQPIGLALEGAECLQLLLH